jgi:carotenoid cleavage dioxygenase-like enzyme
MMHDFALTEKYVVLYDLPVTFSLDAAKAGRMPYAWNPAHEARVGLLSREDSSRGTLRFPVEPCFVFHTLNAGEAVFVPVSLSAGEDEGYVMAFAHDLDGGSTDLVILAAQDFAGEPVARFTCRSASHWGSMQLDRRQLGPVAQAEPHQRREINMRERNTFSNSL